MNDEIKVILEALKHYDFSLDVPEKVEIMINKALDYITNLQQIEQEHKKINGELREENSKLEIALQNIQDDYDRRTKENEKLKENLQQEKKDFKEANDYCFELKDYKSRCEKAIEYIKEHIRIDDEYPDYMEMLIEERDNLLNILQNGSDDNG